jgi:hypothetical protein
MRTAVVVLSSGIGNCVRWTPIIRVLAEQGYFVDVWLDAPDYPQVAELFNSRWVRSIVVTRGSARPEESYDVAVVTHWAPPAARESVRAMRVIDCPDAFWIQHGDRGAVVWTAVQLGYIDPIPAPFVVTSGKRFGLKRRTIAIHAGRKTGWEQKQWNGFGDLVGEFMDFADVVVVGAELDQKLEDMGPIALGRAARGTAADYVGKLSLADTAALLSECVALVSIDSGLSHIAAALPILTFPIYGITRPKREAFALPHVVPIENRDACAPGCRSIRYNARECPGKLACLEQLTAAAVAEKVKPIVDLFLDVEEHNAKRKAAAR